MPHKIAVLAFPGISPFHLSVPNLVFRAVDDDGDVDEELDEPAYRLTVCAVRPGTLPTLGDGFDLAVRHGLEAFKDADTIIVPSWDPQRGVPLDLIGALRTAHRRGARIVSLCLGAYVVAASGIVEGRELTTHWKWAEDLAVRHRGIRVRSDVLWTDLGDVVSSAGTVASLDCCLHLLRRDLGAAVAARVAKRLVMAPHRDGTQAQFVTTPIRAARARDDIGAAMEWAGARLGEPLDLDEWAAGGAGMSRRTFTRRFRDRTGESPGQWLLRRRLELARTLLETTDLPIETVAHRSGLGSAASLRRYFREVLGTSPSRHREQFATTR
ncbi:helix-turn-helix domain-containing protein [Pseudonocardia sp. CA-107938]|uniref:helix-turn-helix domain-containing protein n=1 Tax=Pseudonocardia sp. CA-107938 TaxID=3240021 RepID=UPI003D92651F